jgi:hypothetical protein
MLTMCSPARTLVREMLPVIFNIIGGHSWVGDPVVDYSVHRHCDRVTRQHLQSNAALIKPGVEKFCLVRNLTSKLCEIHVNTTGGDNFSPRMPCQWYVRGGGERKRRILIGQSVPPPF